MQAHITVSEKAAGSPIRVFAVIVLYKVLPANSVSLQTLLAAKDWAQGERIDLQILLYDNTPGSQDPGVLPTGVHYESASENRGLADAYNRALEIAQMQGFEWLLTLDQDTVLPHSFLRALGSALDQVTAVPEVAAVVPQITGEGRMLSPNYFLFDVLPRFFPKGFRGISPRPTFAFNSASTLRIRALRDIGGYSPLFWLDNSDAYIYRQLHLHGRQVYVAGDIQVDHEFSMFDVKQRVSLARYQNIVDAGCAFWDLELGTLAGLYHTASLVYRLYKHWKRGDDPAIRKITRETLRRRIFQSRRRRIREWKRSLQATLPRMLVDREPDRDLTRPKISVCMAAHNGERYIVAQLRSIIPQLSANDEIILADDASTDRTLDCVRSLNDARIHIIESKMQQGVLLTFEQAIRQASGTVICLSDQDDEWHPKKISTILDALRSHPEITMIVSDAKLVDEEGAPIAGSWYAQRGNFTDGFLSNLVRCKYLGCTMAFRARLLRKALPFPRSRQILHDIWIGTVNKLSGGETLYLEEPLVFYRRHGATVTGTRRLSLRRQIKLRLHLLYAAAGFWLRQHVGY